ncbi:MAG: amidase [Ectothiorhodospiraceae bacterium]|nr:amidase [Chromatiales bacterium]MCP5154268.1 amidase [Ectothiorhodospiraceae bacterium]
MTALTHLSLVEAARMVRDGEVSSRELTEACIRRTERLGARLNCYISFDPEGALAQADAADRRRAAGETLGPLHGVPLAHKDMYYREGVVTTCGSRIRRDFRPDRTATVLTRLEAAGALNLGGLNMSEFAFGPTGHNHHFGPARNPWNTAHVTGGSSSGSGSAVAGRLVFGALGSDTGGSIRLPAAMCGLAGIKPTQTRVSRYGVMGLSYSLDTVGPLTRTVRDCARITEVIAGHDPLDPTSSRRPVAGYEAAATDPDIRGTRIGVPANYYYDGVHPEIRSALQASLDVYRSLGAEVVEVTLPDAEATSVIGGALSGTEAIALHRAWLRDRPDDYGPQVRARLEMTLAYPAGDYLAALQVRPRVIRRFVEAVFSRCDVLHCPILGFPVPTIAETDVADSPEMRKMITDMTRCSRPINYLALPGLSVPAGFSSSGLPLSFQLIGRPFDEASLFRFGAAYEAAAGWVEQHPGEDDTGG